MQNHAKRRFNNTNVNVMAAIAIGAMLVFSVAGTKAFADVIQNDIEATNNTVTINENEPTRVGYKVHATSGDTGDTTGKNGQTCNPERASVTIQLDIPTGVTASDSSLTFSTCEVYQYVNFESSTAGLYTITVKDAGAEYNEAPATVKLAVEEDTPPTPTDTTAPTLNLPDDITKEATGPIVVTYTATATDNGQDVPITCTPASGSSFPLGTTTVNCSAKDAAGNTAEGSFTVTVTKPEDKTAPVVSTPADITKEATGPDGAKVTYDSVTAEDNVDGTIAATCDHPSGDTFPLGTTEVTCNATDAAGNTGTGKFTVTVQDKTPPTLTLPADITAEATGPNGAIVTYTATAKDLVDGSFAASCTPASDSTFALGTTEVTCNATDAAGNKADPLKFSVTVQDTKAPAFDPTTLTDITTKATGVSGAAVTYTPTATDLVDTSVDITCTPASGSTFPVGTTTVTCIATDDSGNKATGTFKVSVTLTMAGFYQPVDMGSTINTVKAGSTVPFKFEIFAGSTELTSTTFNGNPIGAFTAKKVACAGGTEDPIEQVVTATGGTALRYDSTSGQFVYNWQTPKTPAGACYDTTFTVTADGSTLTAHFKAK
jgi:hypothetical protein